MYFSFICIKYLLLIILLIPNSFKNKNDYLKKLISRQPFRD
ncbi:hypothetical protein HMPREF1552_00107 [Leptotrichia sp. oral taxon 879 str. F0557]|nr:hypothetical protein HMPREF1552_00107 [Leptotrichia sp. oral taxon 879 str. F0557]